MWILMREEEQAKEGFVFKVGEKKNVFYTKFGNPNATVGFYPTTDHPFIIREAPDDLSQTFILNNNLKVTELIFEKYAGPKTVLEKIK